MDTFQITCKIHDNLDRVIEVGVGSKRFSTPQIWDWINSKTYGFYTLAKGHRATVAARTSPQGRKYLTTHPDGVTDNNLDELPRCV